MVLGIQIPIIREFNGVCFFGDTPHFMFIISFNSKFRCFHSNQLLLKEKPQNDFVVYNIFVTLINSVMKYQHRLRKPLILLIKAHFQLLQNQLAISQRVLALESLSK